MTKKIRGLNGKAMKEFLQTKGPEAAGWVGLLLIHGATLPVTVQKLLTGAGTLPPLSMVLMVWAGLALFLLRAVSQRDILYITSNAIGFALQSVLLSLIVFGG